MSVADPPPDRWSPQRPAASRDLRAVLVRAGAVLALDRGRAVALHYGSANGELAACLDGVGVASLSELRTLELIAPADRLERVLDAMLDYSLAPAGIVQSPAVSWFRVASGRVLTLCDPSQVERLRGRLEFWTSREPTLQLSDRSDDLSTLAIVGAATGQLLRELGVYGSPGDPRSVPPITRTADDPHTAWVLCEPDYALALTPSTRVAALWDRITTAGQAWRICAVGHEALTRYRLRCRVGRYR